MVGGAERVLEALLEDLPAHGIQAHLVCLRRPGPIGEALRRRGLPVHCELSGHRYDPRAFFRLWRLARRLRPQIFYVLDHSNALWHGRLVARLVGRPACVAIHRTKRADGSRSLSRVDRLLLPWTARVIAVSEGHRAYLAAHEGVVPQRLVTIFNGVDPARYERLAEPAARAARRLGLGLPPDATIVVQVAALRPEKQHALSLRAIAKLPQSQRPLLLLVGEGSERRRIEALVAELELGEWVRLFGQREDVPFLLAVCDLLILSSQPTVETFPLCVLEAMAASLPVLATDVGSLREMIVDGQSGRLSPAGDVEAFALALREFLADAPLRRRFGEAGRARLVSNFTRAAMVERTAQLLRECAVGNPS